MSVNPEGVPVLQETIVRPHQWPDMLRLPPNVLIGDALLAKTDELLAEDYRLTPRQRDNAAWYLTQLCHDTGMNAPVLMLNPSMIGGDETAVAGYNSLPLMLERSPSGVWRLGLRLAVRATQEDAWRSGSVEYDMWTFGADAQAGYRRLLVGEAAVGGWLANRGLPTGRLEQPTPRHYGLDNALLRRMVRGGLPASYFTEEDRQGFARYMLNKMYEQAYLATDDYSVLEYALGITTNEGKLELADGAIGVMADHLPVGDIVTEGGLVYAVSTLTNRLPHIQGLPDDIPLGETTKVAAMLAHMYRARAARPGG